MMVRATTFHTVPYVVGLGYSVEFRFDGKLLDVVWSPRLPDGPTMRALAPKYRAARDLALGDLADELGLNIAVVEPGDAA